MFSENKALVCRYVPWTIKPTNRTLLQIYLKMTAGSLIPVSRCMLIQILWKAYSLVNQVQEWEKAYLTYLDELCKEKLFCSVFRVVTVLG